MFKYKASTLLGWCFVILYMPVYTQINQVSNPSFETISSCPTSFNQIKLATGWDTLKMGGGGGPEVFNSCANPNANLGVPVNIFGISYQNPKTGISYANLGFYVNSTVTVFQREYIQTQLLQPLISGKTYCVKFYVSLSNRSNYAIDELGAYFDDGSIYAPYYAPAVLTPHVKSPSGVFYTDTLNWMLVDGLYTATANHQYLTLGNFRTQAATSYTAAYPTNTSIVAEYYIDDVSVIDIATPAYAGRDTLLCNADSVFIGRTPEIGLECQWFKNNIQIAEGAGIWVKPTATQTYIVKQDLCGIIDYDTVTVAINPLCTIGVKELLDNDLVKLYPNPTTDVLHIDMKTTHENANLELFNTTGELALQERLITQNSSLNTHHLQSGIYIVIITNTKTNQRVIKKLVIQK